MSEPYSQDMSHTTWAKVFSRQEARQAAATQWLEILAPASGETVLDIGCGPGYYSLLLADRVGPQGRVIATDRSQEALNYLAALQADRGVTNILRIAADVTTLAALERPAQAALLTVVLHHNDDPEGVIRAAHRLLAPGGRCLVAEYHPNAAGNVGPPLRVRIDPEQVRGWFTAVGFQEEAYWLHPDEMYAFLVRKDHGLIE